MSHSHTAASTSLNRSWLTLHLLQDPDHYGPHGHDAPDVSSFSVLELDRLHQALHGGSDTHPAISSEQVLVDNTLHAIDSLRAELKIIERRITGTGSTVQPEPDDTNNLLTQVQWLRQQLTALQARRTAAEMSASDAG